MFARCVTMQLKPKMAAQFRQTMESEILPMLKRQQAASAPTLKTYDVFMTSIQRQTAKGGGTTS